MSAHQDNDSNRLSSLFTSGVRRIEAVTSAERFRIQTLAVKTKWYRENKQPLPRAIELALVGALKKPEVTDGQIMWAFAALEKERSWKNAKRMARLLNPRKCHIARAAAATAQRIWLERNRTQEHFQASASAANLDLSARRRLSALAVRINNCLTTGTPIPRTMEMEMIRLLKRDDVMEQSINAAYGTANADHNDNDARQALNMLLDPRKVLFVATATSLAGPRGVEHDLNRTTPRPPAGP